jgi:hypothetical protein
MNLLPNTFPRGGPHRATTKLLARFVFRTFVQDKSKTFILSIERSYVFLSQAGLYVDCAGAKLHSTGATT